MSDSTRDKGLSLTEELKAILANLEAAGPPQIDPTSTVWPFVWSNIEPNPRCWAVPPPDGTVAGPSPSHKGDDSGEGSDSEYAGSDSDSDEESDFTFQFNEEKFLLFLKRLHPHIVAKLRAPPIGDIPDLRPGITLQEHQKHAVGKAEFAMNSQFKGMILGDPPGLGKTLSALSIIARTSHVGCGPSIIVAPFSCCQHWMEEIKKFFNDDSMPAFCLAYENATVHEIFRYKIIVTSYEQVSAELSRLRRFSKGMMAYHKGRLAKEDLPKRPTVTLLSGIFGLPGVKPLGPLLILDDAHCIKNYNSRTYSAIYKLRQSLDTCIMMSGTPLDDAWLDAYALLSLLRGHNLASPDAMALAFTGHKEFLKCKEGGLPTLTDEKIPRMVQMMDAVLLRRPITINNLPPLNYKLWQYGHKTDSTELSNESLSQFLQERKAKRFEHAISHFVKARHYAYHPMLSQLHDIEEPIHLASWTRNETADESLLSQDKQRLAQWYQELNEGRNWESTRTVCLMGLVTQHLDANPDDAMVIMDESVFFLDIVQVAISKSFPANGDKPIFRYDGRAHGFFWSVVEQAVKA
ncbi:uncharacterized protein FIESC28_05470 [Fusarium coffeatum]|uniref:Helicase ATP-binding domain-containing protein n=1 Tax=Fusarium coffeatum TaxID=231269 RepID=A0A366RRY3_9HYPO|nr:uncharacterized protein FIESC28_05470 [Fusarium coffeatum]RBR19864.1 hypothetical protein FIESC28_05470 [Fusarium coffeatum]